MTKLAEALEADLGDLLRLADCLPQQILERITSRSENPAKSLLRTAGSRNVEPTSVESMVSTFAATRGVPQRQASQIGLIVEKLIDLPDAQREAILSFLLSMARNSES